MPPSGHAGFAGMAVCVAVLGRSRGGSRLSSRDGIVLAVDGGNSKTDLALVRADGEVLALVRGPLSSPHHLGLDGALDVLQRLLDQASREAGRARNGTVATIAQLLM